MSNYDNIKDTEYDDTQYDELDYGPIDGTEVDYPDTQTNTYNTGIKDSNGKDNSGKKVLHVNEFNITLPWVQHTLKKNCQDDVKCMEIKAELIAREKIKTDLNLPECGNDQHCKLYNTELQKRYMEREYCPVTHPIVYLDGKSCCAVQHWYENVGELTSKISYNPFIPSNNIKCVHDHSSNGCCNDAKVYNCSTEFCYDNPIIYLDKYLESNLKDSNPLCSLLTNKCSDKDIRSSCPKTCKVSERQPAKLRDDNELCSFAGSLSCHLPQLQKSCPVTCGDQNDKIKYLPATDCVDKKEWCANYPNCATDIAKQICPKTCKICSSQGKFIS